jgi:hypothetical protein
MNAMTAEIVDVTIIHISIWGPSTGQLFILSCMVSCIPDLFVWSAILVPIAEQWPRSQTSTSAL